MHRYHTRNLGSQERYPSRPTANSNSRDPRSFRGPGDPIAKMVDQRLSDLHGFAELPHHLRVDPLVLPLGLRERFCWARLESASLSLRHPGRGGARLQRLPNHEGDGGAVAARSHSGASTSDDPNWRYHHQLWNRHGGDVCFDDQRSRFQLVGGNGISSVAGRGSQSPRSSRHCRTRLRIIVGSSNRHARRSHDIGTCHVRMDDAPW